jgi:DNA modification methylase
MSTEREHKSLSKDNGSAEESGEQLTFLERSKAVNGKPVSKRRANNLDGKAWTRYSISLWSDIKKTKEEEELKHPAMFPVQLVTRLLECYTNDEDRIVLDPFAGVGSTIVAAHRAGKTGIGIEIEKKFVEKGLARIDRFLGDTGSTIHQTDAKNLLQFVQPESVDFVVTSPPYWDILLQKRTADYKEIRHYGEAQEDLGKIADYWDFLTAVDKVFKLVLEALKPGKFCCVVVMDLRKGPNFYPYHADLGRLLHASGFEYEDILIWDRRHEYNNMRPLGYPYRFRVNKAHEYILVYRKPLQNGS